MTRIPLTLSGAGKHHFLSIMRILSHSLARIICYLTKYLYFGGKGAPLGWAALGFPPHPWQCHPSLALIDLSWDDRAMPGRAEHWVAPWFIIYYFIILLIILILLLLFTPDNPRFYSSQVSEALVWEFPQRGRALIPFLMNAWIYCLKFPLYWAVKFSLVAS